MSITQEQFDSLWQSSLLRDHLRASGIQADRTDDALQDLAERLLSRPINADKPTHYIKKMARNLAIDGERAVQRRRRLEDRWATEAEYVDSRSPERVFDARRAIAELCDALQQLPLLTQEMFMLNRIHGIPKQRIAERYGLHLSTVEKRLGKATRHCRKAVAEYLDR